MSRRPSNAFVIFAFSIIMLLGSADFAHGAKKKAKAVKKSHLKGGPYDEPPVLPGKRCIVHVAQILAQLRAGLRAAGRLAII